MAAEPPRPAPPRSRRWLVALAIAALVSSWNPAAAPFGLVVGIVSAILAWRALRRSPGRRAIPGAALAVSLVAVVASATVVALTAGSLGIELPGEPVVKGRSQAELDQVLSEAAERTRSRREQATEELDVARRRDARGRPRSGVAEDRGGEERRPPGRDADPR